MSKSANTASASKAISNAKASLKAPVCKKPQQVLNDLAKNSFKRGYIR